ncbi:DNA-3-methyladenine glycosylase [Aquisphaera giovannonii]
MKPLPHSFYDRPAEDVAPELLGKLLVRREGGGKPRRMGRIVEAEAYLGPHDLAAHSSKGRTARTEVMFGPPGYAYVYLIYGMHHCLNAVTGPGNHASAVLLRALEPVENVEASTSGPGRLCRALNIDRTLNGHDLTRGGLIIAEPDDPAPAFDVVAGPRVGVDYAGDWAARPYRFSIAGNRYVSRPSGRA